MVGSYLEMLGRGGQLRGGVPKPCRICGFGTYRAVGIEDEGGVSGAYVTLALNTDSNNVDQLIDTQRISPYFCDSCGHVQLFRYVPPDSASGEIEQCSRERRYLRLQVLSSRLRLPCWQFGKLIASDDLQRDYVRVGCGCFNQIKSSA
jgi:hypothetical protein